MPDANDKKFRKLQFISIAAGLGAGLVAVGIGLASGAGKSINDQHGVTNWPASETKISLKPRAGLSGWDIPKPVTMPSDPKQAAMVKRGEFLTVAGDCMPCHSVAGEPEFAGGRAVGSPFGAVYSPNITPSKRFGIGKFSDQQFYRVLHNGITPGSSLLVFPKYLYPTMPYSAYSKLTYSDVMAIKAYLDTLAPQQIKNRPNTMSFPTNIRAGLWAWRLLYFSPKPVKYQAGWSSSVKHGAYLVQALEHCSACHTPRNIAMASIDSRYLSGGHLIAQTWYAPDITASKSQGLGSWSDATLLNYLRDDGSIKRGAPFGKMKSVVDDSLSRMPASDVQDIVAYLRTVKPLHSHVPKVADAASIVQGKQVFADECARCHQADGKGVAKNFPNLANNEAVWGGKPYSVIGMILGGFQPWHPGQSAMPNFGATLSDGQIAAVTNYVRTAWGNRGAADATANTVAGLRSVAVDEVDLDTGTTAATVTDGTKTRHFSDISGRIWFAGDRVNCRMTAVFSTRFGKRPLALGGACASDGNQFIGRATVNGRTHPVVLRLHQIIAESHVTGIELSGPIGGKGQRLDARIDFVSANY